MDCSFITGDLTYLTISLVKTAFDASAAIELYLFNDKLSKICYIYLILHKYFQLFMKFPIFKFVSG